MNIGIGDLAQSFRFGTQTTAIKTRQADLLIAVSTGRPDDLTRHLSGKTREVEAARHDIAVVDQFLQSNGVLGQELDQVQTVMDGLEALRNRVMERGIGVNPATPAPQVALAADDGKATFQQMTDQINQRFANRSLLSGAATDAQAIADADTHIAAIIANIGTTRLPGDIIAAVKTWFDDPAGGYSTGIYGGATGVEKSTAINSATTINQSHRGDSAAIRETLKGAALAAVASELSGSLTPEAKAELVRTSAEIAVNAASPLTHLRGEIGNVQERIAIAMAELQGRRTALAVFTNEQLSADPFEAASELTAIQDQLSLHFASLSRTSQLSLVNFI